MNVVMVGMDWFPNHPGGGSRYFFQEVRALSAAGLRGHAVVSALKPGQSASMDLVAMSSPDANAASRLVGVRREVRRLLDRGPDLVNSHFALYAFPWIDLLPPSVPLVVNFQGPWADELAVENDSLAQRVRAVLGRFIERSVYRRAARLITLSEAMREVAHRRYGVPLDRILTIPGGLDIAPHLEAPPRAAARERLGWPPDRPILLAVRRLWRRMGLEGLILAMQEVRRAHPGALLLIGGTGPLEGRLRSLIETAGLESSVRLLGFIAEDDLPAAYAAADFTVVPTLALEGFGMTTVESLAAGTPVLGTRVGATPEILDPLSPDLVFERPDAGTMADKLTRALAGALVIPDRDACREHARRYSWEAVTPRILAAFRDAVASRTAALGRSAV